MQAEIDRLNKVVKVLMDRAERNAGIHGSDFNLFHTAVMLEDRVRQRTRELEAALLENEKITRALRESESHNRLLIENSPMCIHEISMDGRITSMNRSGLLMMGLKEECEIQGYRYLDAVGDADREHIATLMDKAYGGESSHFEFKASGPAGQIYKSCFVPIKDKNGRIEKLMGITEDITLRKQLERQLMEREALFHAIFDQASSGIELIDPDTLRFVEVNPAACRMLGYTREEMLRMHLEDTQADLDRAALFAAVRRNEEEGGLVFANRHRCKNGDILDVEVNAQILTISGRRLIVALWRDVTASKRAEEKLVAREREFRMLAENLPDNIARYDRTARMLYGNPALERTLGIPLRDQIGRLAAELGPFEAYQQALLQVAATGEGSTMEMSVPTDNRPRIHAIKMVPELGPDGMPVGVLAVGRDISETKWAEESLRITASVFENSQEGIVITDADNRFVDVNPAFTRITGYTREEVLGKDPALLNSGRHDQAFYEAMWQSLKRDKVWRGEIWNRRKSGEIYPELLSISVIGDTQGQVQRYVSVFSDISYLKAHEDELSRIAHYDALTGVPNRALLADRLAQTFAASKRSGRDAAVVFLDLDNFKPLNDTHGHDLGDLLLIEVARRITTCVREIDTVARFGGDEFVVVLGELDMDRGRSVAQAGQVAEKIRGALAEPYILQHRLADGAAATVEHRCTASIGVAVFDGQTAVPEEVLKQADAAMYRSKETGRNRVGFAG